MPQPLYGVQCVKVGFPELLGEVDRGFINLQILVLYSLEFVPMLKAEETPCSTRSEK